MSTIAEHVAKTEEGSESDVGSESEVEFVWRPVGKEPRRYCPLRPPHPPLKSQPDPEAYARYRAEMHGVPTAIDLWLRRCIEGSCPPSGGLEGNSLDWLYFGTDLVDLLSNDQVLCILHVDEVVDYEPDCPFVDNSTFTLTIKIRVPPSLGFLVYLSESPTVVLDMYYGLSSDHAAPEWVEYRHAPAPIFWLPRPQALEVIRLFLTSDRNEAVRGDAIAWTQAVKRGSFADMKRGCIRPDSPRPAPQVAPPRKCCPVRRRLRANLVTSDNTESEGSMGPIEPLTYF